jgi:hypothetical protein
MWLDVAGKTTNATVYKRLGPNQPDGGKVENWLLFIMNTDLHEMN